MTFMQTMFGFKGRVTRLAYLGYSTLAVVAASLLVVGSMLLMNKGGVSVVIGASIVVGILCGWATLALTVKRLHDMDMSGWHAAWIYAVLFVGDVLGKMPDVGVIISVVISLPLIAWLTFKAGTLGSNRFGPPRKPVLVAAMAA